jgi:HAD superfamily hydrolase (TIGR01549 family)
MAASRPVVLFDWGETLVRIPGMVHDPAAHLACARSAFHAAIRPRFGAAGREIDEAAFMTAYERIAREQIRKSAETLREHRFEDRLRITLETLAHAGVIADQHAFEFATHLGERVLDGMTLEHADVPRMVRALHRNFRLGIVSNYPFGPVVTGSLARLGIADCFEQVIVSGEVGWSKPHPQIFSIALNAMDADPARTIFVGDNPVADMRGAKAAGMATAWYSVGRPGPAPADADFSFDRHEALVPWCEARLQ